MEIGWQIALIIIQQRIYCLSVIGSRTMSVAKRILED